MDLADHSLIKWNQTVAQQPLTKKEVVSQIKLKSTYLDSHGIIWHTSIGKGAFAEVYKCDFKGETVAIKKFDIGIDWKKKAAESEIETIQSVKSKGEHKNLLTFKEIIRTDTEILIVLPLFNESLKKCMQKRLSKEVFFDPATSMHLFEMILEGMEFLHSLGIAHRDLKVC